jgi:cytochrome bd-type quinol oxidase subunit 2
MKGLIGMSVGYLVNAGLLLLAAVGAVRSRPGSVVRSLAVATGAAALAFGPLMVLGNYAALDMHFQIPPRYGFSLLPAMAALAGTAVRSRLGQWALVAVGAALYLAVAVQLLR